MIAALGGGAEQGGVALGGINGEAVRWLHLLVVLHPFHPRSWGTDERDVDVEASSSLDTEVSEAEATGVNLWCLCM